MRLLVFEDSAYYRHDGVVYTDQSFLWFVAQLSERVDLTLLGRLSPDDRPSHYRLPAAVHFVPLPHYPSLVSPGAAVALAHSLRRVWTSLRGSDVAWVLGPHPLAVAIALLGPLARVKVVLGVRQDLPRYVRTRHPDRRWTHVAADALEGVWRRLAARRPVVAVGPELARSYAHAPEVLDVGVCLVSADEAAHRPRRRAERQVLSVGRLDAEKNPLLLADVLARLLAKDRRWRLVVCGDGPLKAELAGRLDRLGIGGSAALLGYVPVDGDLARIYRESDVFLHVSWTEGVPQVLFEAWAAGLPVVATAVGGVAEVARGAAELVPAGDPAAAAEAVHRIATEDRLRARLVAAGTARVLGNTREAVLARLTAFLAAQDAAAGRARRGAQPSVGSPAGRLPVPARTRCERLVTPPAPERHLPRRPTGRR